MLLLPLFLSFSSQDYSKPLLWINLFVQKGHLNDLLIELINDFEEMPDFFDVHDKYF